MSEVLEVAAGPSLKSSPDAGALHRKLSSFGALLLTLSCLSPVFSIYGIGPDVLKHAGTGAAGMFLIGIFAALIWALVYAELGSAYPYAGGDYVGVAAILGPAAGFASLAAWTVTGGPSVALEAQIIATYVAELGPGLDAPWIVNCLTFGSLLLATVVALLAVRTSAIVTGLFLALEMLAVLGLTLAGAWHPVRGLGEVLLHPIALNASGVLGPVALGALAVAGVSASYATVGGNQAIAFGEELRDPHRNMGRVIVWACLIGAFATAVPIILVVLSAGDLVAIFNSPAPFSAFLTSVAGPVAGRALSAGVALAVFNAMIAQIMFTARIYFSLGRDKVFFNPLNRWLASVHGKSGAPRFATLVVGVYSALCCLLLNHTLVIFSSALIVYTLGLVSLAALVGRHKKLTGQGHSWRAPFYPAGPLLGIVMAVAFAISDLLDLKDGLPSCIVLGSVVIVAILWHRFVLSRRPGGWTLHIG